MYLNEDTSLYHSVSPTVKTLTVEYYFSRRRPVDCRPQNTEKSVSVVQTLFALIFTWRLETYKSVK
jgi:hypothetical protein